MATTCDAKRPDLLRTEPSCHEQLEEGHISCHCGDTMLAWDGRRLGTSTAVRCCWRCCCGRRRRRSRSWRRRGVVAEDVIGARRAVRQQRAGGRGAVRRLIIIVHGGPPAEWASAGQAPSRGGQRSLHCAGGKDLVQRDTEVCTMLVAMTSCKMAGVISETDRRHSGCSVALRWCPPGDGLQGLRLWGRLGLHCCWQAIAIGLVYIHGGAVGGRLGCCVCGCCVWLRGLRLLPRRGLQVAVEVRMQRQQARHLAAGRQLPS